MKYSVNPNLSNKSCLLEKRCAIAKNNFAPAYHLLKLCFTFKVSNLLCRSIVNSSNVRDFVNTVTVDGTCSDHCWRRPSDTVENGSLIKDRPNLMPTWRKCRY